MKKDTLIIIVLCLFWLLIESGLAAAFGVRIVNDSVRYMSAANQLILTQKIVLSHHFWYFSYVSLVAAVFLLGGEAIAIVAIQVVISALAAAALYYVVCQIVADKYTAYLSVFLYLFWLKIHQLHFYVLTESLFSSMVILSFALLCFLKKRQINLFFALPLFLYTALIRPTGVVLIICLIIYWLSVLYNSDRCLFIRVCIVGMPFVSALFILLLNRMLSTFFLVERYCLGELIFVYEGWRIESDRTIITPPEHYAPLTKLFFFFWHNLWFMCRLMGAKLILFFANIKPYFSWQHNILIVLVLYPIYGFAIKGFLNNFLDKPAKHYMLSFIAIQAGIVMLTVVDWDGRFLIPVLPFIFVFAAIGLVSFFNEQNIWKNRKFTLK